MYALFVFNKKSNGVVTNPMRDYVCAYDPAFETSYCLHNCESDYSCAKTELVL